MCTFIKITVHELKMLFLSTTTYVASTLFLGLMGIIYWLILKEYSVFQHEQLPAVVFFELFWLPTFFMIPLLTMGVIAQDNRVGTLETIATTSVNLFSWIISKIVAVYAVYIFLWILTMVYPVIAAYCIEDQQSAKKILDGVSWIGGYAFVALSSFLYIAVGVFASSVTRSQLIAAILTFVMLFVIIVGGGILRDYLGVYVSGDWSMIVDYFQTFDYLADFTKGIIDTRPFVFYLTSGFLFIMLSYWTVEAKLCK